MNRTRLALLAGPLLLVVLLSFGIKTKSTTTVAPAAAAPASTAAPNSPLSSPTLQATGGPRPAPTLRVLASPTPTDAPRPAPPPAAMNERAALGNQAVMASAITRAATTPGMTLVVVTVEIEGVGAHTPYSPHYFTLVDAEANTYSVAAGGADALAGGQLAPGAAVRGTVAFAVPAAASGLELRYQPLVLLGIAEPLRISLAAAP